MPKRKDIKKILVIGSGPIVIGQAAEFDYAGTQACQSLKEEGYQVVLINSNPATIMTDRAIADKIYIEPINLDFAKRIIYKERPQAILGSLGGQTGLNLVVELANSGILKENNIEVLGTALNAINCAEDRQLFKELMNKINEPVPESAIVHKVEEALEFANKIGYHLVVRPAYTLGGTGGGFARNEKELIDICETGLKISPVGECLIEKSIAGYKEIEYEVMRDNNDNAIVVCNMENVDPVGIHTGDSIVVAPCQTLSDVENQTLRNVSLKIIRALKICGGCNVQIALDPKSFNYYIIEVNPRVGMTLDEIINPITKKSFACFEPSIDYIVTKFPRLPFDKFPNADRQLGTQMKATGEVMSIGRNFEESFLKAVRSLEIKCDHIENKDLSKYTTKKLWERIEKRDDLRMFIIAELIRRGKDIEEIINITHIDRFFLNYIKNIIDLEKKLKSNTMNIELLRECKKHGFSDGYIARNWNVEEIDIYNLRKENNIIPVYKMVDTCAGEFESETPYFYSTYETENESHKSERENIIVLGSGPIRIGQGIEFDYSTVHSVMTIRNAGYEAIVINNNPETVSTDFSISDKLYFEPLTIEDVMHIIELEKPKGVIVQFGGQTAINLAEKLTKHKVNILGTSLESINKAEDRHEFEKMLKKLNIPQPMGETAFTVKEALIIAKKIGYPVLVRPSYVLGGRAMEIVNNDEALKKYMSTAVKEVSNKAPILIDKYIIGKEVETDAIADSKNNVFIPGIMEHIERAGIHSGDSISVYPTQTISKKAKDTIIEYTEKIGKGFNFIGLYNIQFIIDKNEHVYVLEVNPRSSRTVPFLSKITNVPMVNIATMCILGKSLKEQGYKNLYLKERDKVFVKAPVFSFAKLTSVDTLLGPEMKSTGEALGFDINFEKALYKALRASGMKIPLHGNVLLTISDNHKNEVLDLAKRFFVIGYGIYATKGTADFLRENGLYVKEVSKIYESKFENIIDIIRFGKVDYVINTIENDNQTHSDSLKLRRASAENNIPCMTSLDTAYALLKVIESMNFMIFPISDM